MANLSNSADNALQQAIANPGAANEIKTILNAVDVLGATEAGYLDGVTAGTVLASKAVVVDGSKAVDTLTVTTLAATNITAVNGVQSTAVAVTATVGGATTGLIPAGASHVTVTASVATKQITLPTNVIGTRIAIVTPTANGVEMICVDAGAKINDVVCGATNEAALVGDSHFVAECISATEWIVRGFTKLGADIAAIVPDSL